MRAIRRGGIEHSFAGRIGHALEPIIRPLGFTWEIGVAILASFAAREVFVSTLATVYNLADAADSSQTLLSALKDRFAAGTFSLPSALALLVFYVFACQCISTIAAVRRETGSWRWSLFLFAYMTALAYGGAWFVYDLSSWILG